MYSEVLRLPATTSQEELLKLVHDYNERKDIHGLLVQVPLPEGLDEEAVLKEISAKKDVDGFHILSVGSLFVGLPGFISCTPKGILKLIQSTGVDITGKHAVVVGRSNNVGKPAAMLLLNENATVTICHSRTKNLQEVCASADILVAAVGKPGMIKGDFIKPGAIVIDVGTTRGADGKLKGDVVFDEAMGVAGYITPVPGGVGPMTITMLLENTVEAAEIYG